MCGSQMQDLGNTGRLFVSSARWFTSPTDGLILALSRGKWPIKFLARGGGEWYDRNRQPKASLMRNGMQATLQIDETRAPE